MHRRPELHLAGSHRARPRIRGRVSAAIGLVVGLTLAGTQSHAYWSVATTPGSAAGGAATTVMAGPTPTSSVVGRNGLRVSWDASRLGDGTPVTGYTLTRVDESGAGSPATGGCAGTLTATSCTETGLPDGRWSYRVTPRFREWTGPSGAGGTSVLTDATAPSNDIYPEVLSGGLVRIGAATYYYRGMQGGSFHLVNALRDSGSGPAQSVTGALGAQGWTHQPSSVSSPAGGPYRSGVFTWAAGTSGEFDFGVAGIDAYGNTSPATLQFRVDNDPPTGGGIGYQDGPTSNRTVTIQVADAADARAGIGSRVLQGAYAPLSGNTCGTFSGWSDVLQNPGPTVRYTVPATGCYRARHVVVDRVGNVLVRDSPAVVKVRDYAEQIRATQGLVGYWRMNDSGTTLGASVGANGSYGGGPAQGQGGAIAGDDDRSVLFDGNDDFARVARPVADDFSLELWFRSTQSTGGGNNWWEGAGLVDAEVSGAVQDFGVSLLANGRVAAGVGNPDRTAVSGPGLNDDRWHHVVMTRARASGLVELYVDGQRVSTVTGTTASLTASSWLDLGRLQTGVNYYRGHLDEVAIYDRVVSEATVRDHYVAGLP